MNFWLSSSSASFFLFLMSVFLLPSAIWTKRHLWNKDHRKTSLVTILKEKLITNHSMTNLNWIGNKGKAIGEVSHSQWSKAPHTFISNCGIVALSSFTTTFCSLSRGCQCHYVWYHNHSASEYDPVWTWKIRQKLEVDYQINQKIIVSSRTKTLKKIEWPNMNPGK